MLDMQLVRSPGASLAGELAGGVALGGNMAAGGATLMRPGPRAGVMGAVELVVAVLVVVSAFLAL